MIKKAKTIARGRKTKNDNSNITVAVAMSGGVDSSLVAYLLKKQGFYVIGIFVNVWSPPIEVTDGKKRDNLCCDTAAYLMACRVASQLDIPLYAVDFTNEFKKEIVDYYIDEYEHGRTPTPCAKCNRFIKFGALWDKAKSLGAEYLATGHYVRLQGIEGIDGAVQSISANRRTNYRKIADESRATNLKDVIKQQVSTANYGLFRSRDQKKDQTYFLWDIDREIIPHLMFPLGGMIKKDVKVMAEKAGLPAYDKKESQGVCFVWDGDNRNFLLKYAKKLTRSGDIVDTKGNVLGRHRGLIFYTIGQREGLGSDIAGAWAKVRGGEKKNSVPPLYVTRLDIKNNRLVVGENADVFSQTLVAGSLNVLDEKILILADGKKKVMAQIRGGHPPDEGIIEGISFDKNGRGGEIKFRFSSPVRAITPGQSVVFFYKDQLLAGGIIK